MGELADIRYVQLARIAGLPRDATPAAVEHAVRAMPGRVADAFFSEAADSDDVIDRSSALQYLEDRLAFFDGIIDATTAGTVRQAYMRHLEEWGP